MRITSGDAPFHEVIGMRHFLFRSVAGVGSLLSLVTVALMASAAWAPNIASAATVHVMNCQDSGVGSLRGSVATALSGDTIDLTHLHCRKIVLTSGQIVVPQQDLTLVGPGRSRLVLDGNHASRVFMSVGRDDRQGMLVLKRMTIANGHFVLPPEDGLSAGGCILANDNLELDRVDVHDCAVEPYATGGTTAGGGVFAGFHLQLLRSNLFSNVARNGEGGGAAADYLVAFRSHIHHNSANSGGGVTGGEVSLSYSTVDNNSSQREGGGIFSQGPLVINKSTVSNNRTSADPSGGTGGGAWGGDVHVYDSTFSGNAAYSASAIEAWSFVEIANSTIAFNRQTQPDTASGGAVVVHDFEEPPAAQPNAAAIAAIYTINSSIVARNLSNGIPGNDIGPDYGSVSGANDIIERATIPLPADTMSIDPLLAPLADNGGPTRTHALRYGSPAIDRGNNSRNRRYDQRGPGFLRVRGAAPDIGAFERQ
jgi:hypothetical protein